MSHVPHQRIERPGLPGERAPDAVPSSAGGTGMHPVSAYRGDPSLAGSRLPREPLLVVIASARMRLAPVVLGCAAALVLSGCGAGQTAATSQAEASIDGSNGGVGSMLVRDVVLAYPENETNLYPRGADAPMELVIVNEGDRPDTLVSVSTPAARGVLIQGNTEIPGDTAVTVIEGDEQQLFPVPWVEPVPLPRPELPAGPAAPEAGSSARLGLGELRIVLIDLTRPIRAGETVPVTFVFRNAGEVTVPVPIANPGLTREEIRSTPGPAEE